MFGLDVYTELDDKMAQKIDEENEKLSNVFANTRN